ncbi:hypothetical protein AB0B45_25530 [Nonomuraea sp. NPDC049152]|uniref:hypothetical protein n=1 Tax=Nonomuraea sp. NPDC049152 TaxID=3154350 RepID=UPI0033DE6D72
MLLLNALLVAAVAVTPSPEYDTAHANAVKLEQAQVSCMKAAGLEYLPADIDKDTRSDADRKALNGDYAAMRAKRAKEGFGVWSWHVYPKSHEGKDHPNDKIILALPESKHKAYQAAQDKCFVESVKTVLGKDVSSTDDYYTQLDGAYDKLAETELNGAPNLIKLGGSFATCLKVTSAKPTDLAERGRKAFLDERTEVAREQGVRAPAQAKIVFPRMTPAQARPYLKKEVKAALEDLECGKDFYAAYAPQAWKLQQKVYAEYGLAFTW